MSWDCGFKYIFAFSPTLKAGVMCKLQGRDDLGRIELVQKLARENCQFLQTDKKDVEKSEHVSPFSVGELQGWRGEKRFSLALLPSKFWKSGIPPYKASSLVKMFCNPETLSL